MCSTCGANLERKEAEMTMRMFFWRFMAMGFGLIGASKTMPAPANSSVIAEAEAGTLSAITQVPCARRRVAAGAAV
jgi:hypothetical protein